MRWVSYLMSHRYDHLPLLPSDPGGFSRSWSHRTYPTAKVLFLSDFTIRKCKKLSLHTKLSYLINMNTSYKFFTVPVIKIGLSLGLGYVVAQYLFYYGGKSVIANPNFDSAIQLLTVMGLYFGLHYCKRLYPQARFWQFFFFGFSILAIAVTIKTLFAILLYGILAPELGITYTEILSKQMLEMIANTKSLPQTQYQQMIKATLTPFTIPILEGISLSISGLIFSVFIAALHNMFRK